MGDRTVYVRPADEELWQWAVTHAKSHRMPVSGLVMTALERYRADLEREKNSEDPPTAG